MVFTPKIRELFREAGYVPESVLKYYHDSLIASVCCSLDGIILCDDDSYILHRTHQDNASGDYFAHNVLVRIILTEMHILRRAGGTEPEIAQWILKTWDSVLSQDVRDTLELIAACKNSLCARLKFFLSPKFSAAYFGHTILGKVKMLFGLL